MSSVLFVLGVIASLLAIGVWGWKRSEELREEAEQRESAALALLQADRAPVMPAKPQITAHNPGEAPLDFSLTHTVVGKMPGQLAALADIDLRDLILAYYDARGYREEWVAPDMRPVELVLRHRQESQRSYAYVHLNAPLPLDGGRLAQIGRELQARHFKRAIIAAPHGFDQEAAALAATMRLRLYDRTAMMSLILELTPEVQARLAGMAKARAKKRAA